MANHICTMDGKGERLRQRNEAMMRSDGQREERAAVKLVVLEKELRKEREKNAKVMYGGNRTKVTGAERKPEGDLLDPKGKRSLHERYVNVQLVSRVFTRLTWIQY
jgi:hypothetical protein